mgnify:CR=1 FL=1
MKDEGCAAFIVYYVLRNGLFCLPVYPTTSAAWDAEGVQFQVLLHGIEVHIVGLRTELLRGEFVFDDEDRLAQVYERQEQVTFLVEKTFLAERPIKEGSQLWRLHSYV